MPRRARPRIFVDADALLAACASPSEHGASLVILRMAEITLVEAFCSIQVIREVERNLRARLPQALRAFQVIVPRCLQVVSDPSDEELLKYGGLADEKDLPILVAALLADFRWLITFNTRHFLPGHPSLAVMRPGEFLAEVRDLLSPLGAF